MKQFLLFIFILSLFAPLRSQSWCPQGATWHFSRYYGVNGAPIGFTKLTYTHDTTINTISCKVIEGHYTGRSAPSLLYPVTTGFYKTYYTYENNHVIYLSNGSNAFDTVVNFNATIGDKWLRLQGSTTRRALVVTDTGHVAINGFNLKTVTTNYTTMAVGSSTPHILSFQTRFVERAFIYSGGVEMDLFPQYYEHYFPYDGPNSDGFQCYEDNTFPLYNNSNTECEAIDGIITNKGFPAAISVYPNPAGDAIQLEFPTAGDYELKISDLFGHYQPLALSKKTGLKLEAGLGTLNPGVYFLQVFEKGQLLGTEKIIKE